MELTQEEKSFNREEMLRLYDVGEIWYFFNPENLGFNRCLAAIPVQKYTRKHLENADLERIKRIILF